MNDYNLSIGKQIKKLRLTKKLTLKQLSDLTGLSTGFLSQLERGLSTIAIDSLANLAKILGTDLSDFFKKELSVKQDPVTRSFDQEYNLVNDNIIQFILSNNPAEYTLLPRIFLLLPFASITETQMKEYSHEGEEFIYVLEGVLTVYLKGKKHTLYPGDSIQIHSIFDHNWINHTNKPTRFISVNSPNPLRKSKNE